MTANVDIDLAARNQLSRGISILERLGIIDFNGHFSVRLNDGNILINTGSSIRSAIGHEDFVVVGPDGDCPDDAPRPPAELPLHVAIYRTRPDVKAIVHGHPHWSTLLSSAGLEYQVTMAQGALLGEVPTFSSPLSMNNAAIGNALAELLGHGRAALLRSHGSVVVGKDVLETTVLAIYLELNAERQVRAAVLGNAYIFTDDEVRAFRKGLEKRGLFEKCWNYYLHKFDLADVK